MKKTNSFYFFFFLLGLVVMIVSMTSVVLTDRRFIFIGIIGVGVVVLLVWVSIKLSNGTLEQRTKLYKECVECNQEIDINSEYCKHCGANQIASVTCDFCGKENELHETVCQHCNALLK